MVFRIKHAALALAISMGALVGACGPAPQPETPAGGAEAKGGSEANPPEQTGVKPAEGTPPSEAKGPDKAPEKGPDKAPPAAGPAKSMPLQRTMMEADLKKIGFDMKKIPELEKLSLSQKKKVMLLFQSALGMDACTGCHVEGDFRKETRNMKVAREMWRHFVVPLRAEDGATLFCDSCHNGSKLVLNRSDRKAVEKFMEDEYEHKLAQASKAEVECSTCHGDAMELKIVEKLWGIGK